jgi:hypothetical protein
MNPLLQLLIGPVFDVIGKVIDRAWPDPTEAAKIKAQVFQAQQEFATKELDASLQLALQQMKVNEAEAASGSAYAAGWRPTVGYIGCIALAYQFIVYPIANYAIAVFQFGVTPPPLGDTSQLFTLIFGMLGIGVMRTWEKGKGVNS